MQVAPAARFLGTKRRRAHKPVGMAAVHIGAENEDDSGSGGGEQDPVHADLRVGTLQLLPNCMCLIDAHILSCCPQRQCHRQVQIIDAVCMCPGAQVVEASFFEVDIKEASWSYTELLLLPTAH